MFSDSVADVLNLASSISASAREEKFDEALDDARDLVNVLEDLVLTENVELDLEDDVLNVLSLKAHEKRMKLNDYVTVVISEYAKSLVREEDGSDGK